MGPKKIGVVEDVTLVKAVSAIADNAALDGVLILSSNVVNGSTVQGVEATGIVIGRDVHAIEFFVETVS
jgi:hypothetical protein